MTHVFKEYPRRVYFGPDPKNSRSCATPDEFEQALKEGAKARLVDWGYVETPDPAAPKVEKAATEPAGSGPAPSNEGAEPATAAAAPGKKGKKAK